MLPIFLHALELPIIRLEELWNKQHIKIQQAVEEKTENNGSPPPPFF